MTTGHLQVVTEIQRNSNTYGSTSIGTPQSNNLTPYADSYLHPHNAQSIYSATTPASYRSACTHFSTTNDDMSDRSSVLSPGSESSMDASEGCADVSKEDIVIAVMGPTGAGKSTFVNVATGSESVRVGHNLKSCTAQVQTIRCKDPKNQQRDIVFVDTPGFDDTYRNDADILETTATWLKNTYSKGVTLSGILFFHRITDNRISNTVLRNLTMFQQLCGDKALTNVIFVTTQWDLLQDPEEGICREKELYQNYWKPFIENGSQIRRFQYTCASAWDIINATRRASLALRIQKELVNKGLTLPETSAGRSLFSWLSTTAKSLKKLVRRMERVLKNISTSGNNQLLNSLEEDLLANKTKLSSITNQMRRLLRRKPDRESVISSGSSSTSSSSSSRYILVEKLLPGKARVPQTAAHNATTTALESDDSSISDTISLTIVNVPEDNLNDEGPNRQSQSHGLTYALQMLRLAKAAVTGLPVPGLQSVVSVALQITELLNNARDTHDSLVNLMKDASQLIEIITQDVQPVQGKYPQNIISAIEKFSLELGNIIGITEKIKAAESKFVTRYVLQPEDQRLIANCNEAMKYSLNRLQIQLELTAVAQNEVFRKGLERLEKHIEKLNPLQCNCHLHCAVSTQPILNS